MVAKKKRKPYAQQTSSVDDLVQKIKASISDLVAEECDPKPPGCEGALGSGTYNDLAELVQQANSSRRNLISAIRKDFNSLANKIGG